MNSVLFFFVAIVTACQPVELNKASFVTYHPGMIYGDGQDGRRAAAFSEVLPTGTYYSVRVQMRRVTGGENTFVNLRFGEGSPSLQNGRRVYLTNNKPTQQTWHFDRTTPGEQPLILNVYNGEVEVLRIQAAYD